MKHISCTVVATEAVFGARRLVTLSAPDLPRMRPGQLLLARVNETLDPFLPTAYFPLPAGGRPPVFPTPAREPGELPPGGGRPPVFRTPTREPGELPSGGRPGELALLLEGDDPVGRLDGVGRRLELIAPVGNGFALDAATRRLLLVADADWLAPLIALAHEASQKQIAVSLLVHGGDTPDDVAMAAALSEMLPFDVEYEVRAELSAVLPGLLGWADQLCAAGDAELYALLKEAPGLEGRMVPGGGRPRARDAGGVLPAGRRSQAFRTTERDAGGVLPAGFAQVIVAPVMACGFGACQGCAVETAQGMRLACVDGPVFDLGWII